MPEVQGSLLLGKLVNVLRLMSLAIPNMSWARLVKLHTSPENEMALLPEDVSPKHLTVFQSCTSTSQLSYSL